MFDQQYVAGVAPQETGGAGTGRREIATDAAIALLAAQGSRGLTHRELDRQLGWPFGSASNYFRRRNDVFVAVAERIMQLDLADIAVVERCVDDESQISVDFVANLLTDLLARWLTAENRSRAFARSEILFESVRNAELRAAVHVQIARVERLMQRVLARLGSATPAASASLFSLQMSSLHVSALVAKRALTLHQLRSIVRSALVISMEQVGSPEEADDSG